MKISVIMPSLLEDFPNSASHRGQSFIRAVDSFLHSKYKNAELVIISDGCDKTIKITNTNYKDELESGVIKLLELPRHPLFTGAVRQAGINIAIGDVICNLDTDDYFLSNHLTSIACSFSPQIDWCYFSRYIRPDNIKGVDHFFDCDGKLENMNNGSIAWRRGIDVTWEGCDGREDNKAFISQLLKNPKYKKIYGTGYVMTNVQIKNVTQ